MVVNKKNNQLGLSYDCFHGRTISSNADLRKRIVFGERVYEKVLISLVKHAYKTGLIKGKYIAMDNSFVHTFSKRGEIGSEEWNEFKKGYGFKLHLLIDCETKFPIALCTTKG